MQWLVVESETEGQKKAYLADLPTSTKQAITFMVNGEVNEVKDAGSCECFNKTK